MAQGSGGGAERWNLCVYVCTQTAVFACAPLQKQNDLSELLMRQRLNCMRASRKNVKILQQT